MTLMSTIVQLTGIPEGVINWLIGTFGLAALTQVWAFIQMPRQIELLRIELRDQRIMFRRRVFPKLKRIEDYLIEKEIRELHDDEELSPLLQQMRADQREEADDKDRELSPTPS